MATGDLSSNSCQSDLNLEEDIIVCNTGGADGEFDSTIGHIEDIIMEEPFQDLLSSFMDKHYREFEEKEENKLIYTDIFREYTDLIEHYIEEQLLQRIPSFSMADFLKQMESRKELLEGEIFEMLQTFGDFMAFKDMFLDYKKSKNDSVDIISDLLVTSSLNPS